MLAGVAGLSVLGQEITFDYQLTQYYLYYNNSHHNSNTSVITALMALLLIGLI